MMRIMSGEIADDPSFEVNFQSIAKGLREKKNPLAIVGKVSAFAKPGEPLNVAGKMVSGSFGFGGLDRSREAEAGQQKENAPLEGCREHIQRESRRGVFFNSKCKELNSAEGFQ